MELSKIIGSVLVIGFFIGLFVIITSNSPVATLSKPWEFTKRFFGPESFNTNLKFIGINFNDNFLDHFAVALWAGALLWVSSFPIKWYYSYVKYKDMKKVLGSPLETEFKKIRWINTVAGTPFRFLIMAIGFTVLTQIPIITTIIQTITLSAIIENFWYKIIILAIEIGYLPAIIDWYMIKRLEWKYEEKVRNVSHLRPYMQKI